MKQVHLAGLEVAVWLHSAEPPDTARFDAALAAVEETIAKKVHGDISRVRSLVVSDGGAPSTKQRARIKQVYRDTPVKMAAFVAALDNPILRGVAAALRWVNPNFMAYAPRDWLKGLGHLGLAEHSAELLAVCEELQKIVGPTKTLTAVRNVLTK